MKQQEEYMVHIWGGAWNSDAFPSIVKDHGIRAGYYYFYDEDKKNSFLALLRNPLYQNQGLMIVEKYGVMSHKRTIFVGTFRFGENEFVVPVDFGYEYPEDQAVAMFTIGDYSCDCNRSLFIRQNYSTDAIPELNCGKRIELIKYHFEYKD